ncbi:MAG: hypothetical protein VXZ96_02590 [Myxococcota bacterium]|nr:hypothetical protein [Myxococcota bacterium]
MSNKQIHWTFWLCILALLMWAPDAWLGMSFYDHHDLRHHHLPWRAWAAQEWLKGEIPLWAPIGLGFPLAAEAQTGVFYPPTMFLFMIFDPSWALNLSILGHLSLALFGMKYFVRGLRLSEEASVLAAFGFAFGGLMSTHMLYLGMFTAWSWLPWALWAYWNGRYGWLVVSLSAMVVAGHPQAAVLGWIIVGSLSLISDWGQWRRMYFVFGSALLAAGITSPQWVSALELSQFSLRDGGLNTADAAVGSMPLIETVSIVLPYFFGYERPSDIAVSYWHRGPLYWGAGVNFWEMCTYVGAPVLVCAFLGYRRKKWLLLVLFSLLMMLGDTSPVWWLVHWVPPFNVLRFPVRFSIGLVLGLSIMAAYGYDRITSDEVLGRIVSRWLFCIVLSLIVFLFLSGTVWDMYSDTVGEWLRERYQAREPLPIPNISPEVLAALPPIDKIDPILRSNQITNGMSQALSPVTHWAGLLTMAMFALVLRLKKSKRRSLLIAVILFAELHWFGSDYQSREANPMWSSESESKDLIEQNGLEPKDRIATVLRHQAPELDGLLLSSNLGMLHGFEDVMVPSPLRLVRHEALLTKLGMGLGAQGQDALIALSAFPELVDMIGVRYLMSTEQLTSYPLIGGTAVSVYENLDHLPFAWFLSCGQTTESPWEMLESLKPREWVMLETGPSIVQCDGPLEYIEPEVEFLGTQSFNVHLKPSKKGFLVIRESWYPGWTAKVNGAAKPIQRANWTLSAIPLDQGDAHVEFRYSPWWLKLVLGLALLSTIFSVFLVQRWNKL